MILIVLNDNLTAYSFSNLLAGMYRSTAIHLVCGFFFFCGHTPKEYQYFCCKYTNRALFKNPFFSPIMLDTEFGDFTYLQHHV